MDYNYDTKELKAAAAEAALLRARVLTLTSQSPRENFSQCAHDLEEQTAKCAALHLYFSTPTVKKTTKDLADETVKTLHSSRFLLATIGGAHPTGWASLPPFFGKYKPQYAGAYLAKDATVHFFIAPTSYANAGPSYILVADLPGGILVTHASRFCRPCGALGESQTWDEACALFTTLIHQQGASS